MMQKLDITLLIVEDDQEVREGLAYALGRHFQRVVTAADGKAGIEAFYQYAPGLIITDLAMPRMGGPEMIEAIKATGSDVSIIVVSAHNESEYLLPVINMGVDQFVTKPVELKPLMQKCHQILQARQIQEKYQRQEQRFGTITEAIEVGLWDWDMATNNVHWEATTYRMIGYEPDAFVLNYEKFESLMHPDDLAQAREEIQKQLEAGGTFVIEFRQATAGGGWLWIEGRGRVVAYDKDHKPTRMVGTHLNIEDRKQAELQSEHYRQELEKFNADLESRIKEEVAKNREQEELMINQSRFVQMGEMLSMIAHQWRQPLNAITLAAMNLKAAKELESLTFDQVDEAATFVEQQAQKMSQTINDFMDFFKPSKAEELFEIDAAIDDALSIVEAQLASRNITFGVYYLEESGQSVMIRGQKNDMEHIILNLISNARDAIDAQDPQRREIRIGIDYQEGGLSLSIEDSAGGIPKEHIDRIFDPYFTTKPPAQGTGIGLYMSRTIIERNFGGTIAAHNTPHGACFTLHIPTTKENHD